MNNQPLVLHLDDIIKQNHTSQASNSKISIQIQRKIIDKETGEDVTSEYDQERFDKEFQGSQGTFVPTNLSSFLQPCEFNKENHNV